MSATDYSIDAYGALLQYDGGAWPASISKFWAGASIEEAWGPERAGTCKNSREVICGLIYWVDQDYAIQRFKRVSETSKRRGNEAIARFRRDNKFQPKRKPSIDSTGSDPQPPAKPAKKKVEEAIYDGGWAGVEDEPQKFEESSKAPELLPTDSMKIKKVNFEGETIWVAENGMAFLDNNGQPDDLIGTYKDGELTFKD